ncbi:hypothetical protein D9757_010744 [Collybiopsis confluens]|uniref:Ricin B lectin domain-containing protein n=1 Tax=Collybiopsis confluens TaxID=2823264 RepID=A0A8H5GZU8_9AGAR|nr:hypothetical protein D9757_010744 [Collybiopsis confluens]
MLLDDHGVQYAVENAVGLVLQGGGSSGSSGSPDSVDALGLLKSQIPQSWSVTTTVPGLYTLTCESSDKRFEIFLAIKGGDKPGPQEVRVTNSISVPPRQKWDIQEVNPSVPKDTYRIRTLTGTVVTTNAVATNITLEALGKGEHQEWEVDPKGNGKCTIKSVSENVYLAWEKGQNGFAQIAKTSLPHVWTVQSLGDYTHGIAMTYTMPDSTQLHLSLSTTQNGQVTLKPKKVSFNQIWLFEAVNVSQEATSIDEKKPSSATRDPDITAGGYELDNVGTKQYMYTSSTPVWRVSPQAQADKISNRYNLNYVGSSAEIEFTLSESASYYFEVSGDLLTIGNRGTDKWILDKVNPPVINASGKAAYYICVASNPSLVLSGDTRKDINDRIYFTVAAKINGYINHYWYLNLK